MRDEVALVVNGRRYLGWKSIRVTQSIESLAGSFALGVSDRWDGVTEPWPIKNEDACRVEISNGTVTETVIDGYIDGTEIKASATERSLAYAGKDRSAALVKCSFLVPGARPSEYRWSFRNMDLAQYFTEIAKPHGIRVSVQPGLALNKTPLHVAHPGERCLEAIRRAASPVGVLVVSGAGGIVITRAGNTRAASLIEGWNIKEASFRSDASNRFHSYRIALQAPGTDEAFGEATQIFVEAIDEDVRSTSHVELIRADAGYATAAAARRRADWEARTRAALADAVVVTVQGWRQPNGTLWPVNALTHVKAPKMVGVDGEMLISQVERTVDKEGGQITQLHVVRPDAFLPQPQAVVRGQNAWNELANGGL